MSSSAERDQPESRSVGPNSRKTFIYITNPFLQNAKINNPPVSIVLMAPFWLIEQTP